MKIFVIADTHFFHANMVVYEGRPPDFDQRIVANWNAAVGPDDVVFHLGDVALGPRSGVAEVMARLNGRKILCLGNHDTEKVDWYLRQGFAFACTYFVYRGVVFSHRPVTPLPAGALHCVHGHFHRGATHNGEERGDDYYRRHRDRYHLVHIEERLAPIPLEDVLGDRS